MKTNNLTGYLANEAVIAEMTNDATSIDIDIPVDQALVDRLTEDDANPMFITIEVLNEGKSRNGKVYDKKIIDSVAEQINEKTPDGYWGHLEDKDRATKYPEPQTIWLGAVVKEVGGKTRLFAKGYVLPEASKLRSYLKKAKAVGKNVAVSIYGLARVFKNRATNEINVLSYKLESIDWARPGSQGILTLGGFSLTSEMTDDINKGEDMTKEEALKSATADELKEHVSSEVVSEMVDEAVAEKTNELETVVSEMADIRDTLGVDENGNVLETVKEMTNKMSEMELDTELRQKVESQSARTVIKEMVLSEMASGVAVTEAVDKVLGSETGQTVIKEMIEAAPRVAPMVSTPAATTARKYTKKS